MDLIEAHDDDRDEVLHAIGERLDDALPFIIGLGASAGGLEALTQVLESLAGLSGMAIVVVQHLSADYKSMMPELLARHTDMEVVHAQHGVVPLADTVYVIEPDTVLSFKAGRLHVQPAHKVQGKLFLPINEFFRSLAEERRSECAVVVLSGTGSDGASGLRAAKGYGAVTICQLPESARFDGMPRAAMATGAVDLVLTPDHVLPQLMQMRQEGQAHYFSAAAGHGELVITRILAALRTHTNIDFNYYKPATVVRRVERRMRELELSDAREYADRVYADPDEARELRDDLLIGVTRFLRDEGAIEAVRAIAIPRLVAAATETPLRLWVAGCSTGEEAYSLAMLLQEALDTLPSHKGFKLFATDVDPEAIERASSGEFNAEAAQQLPDRLRERYFVARGTSYVVTKALREKLLFSKHDLIQDPPFSHLDMISCRNLLIYFKPAVQDRVMRMLSTAIKDQGILWLGASETIGDRTDQFETLDSRWRLYVARPNRKRSAIIPLPGRGGSTLPEGMRRSKPDQLRPLLEALQETYVPPCLVLDANYRLMYRFGALESLLRFPSGPVTLDVRDLLPDELSVLVTALLAKARDGGDVVYRELQISTDSGPRRFDLRARGVHLPEHGPLIALFFEGLRAFEHDPQQLSPSGVDSEARDRMEMLERELRQTRESLQATIEELESSNEELQATNEELIAANEELQSTNEELQSVNEELHTVNAEYSEKVNELTGLNDDMDQLFASVDVGILLLDDRFVIRRFNSSASDYFNVLPQDVGRPLMHLSHRLRYPNLLEDCALALRNTTITISRRVTAQDGRQVQVHIRGHETHMQGSTPGKSLVVTVTDTTSVEGTQQQLSRLAVALENSPVMIAVVDGEDRIVHANSAFAATTGRELKTLIGATLTQLVHPSERDRTREALARTRTGARWRGVMRTLIDGKDRFELVRFVPATSNDASVVRISETLDDRFVPYDKDRAPGEPSALGPLCYCLWTNMENQRFVDARAAELLELASEDEFDLDAPERFADAEDARVLRELIEARDPTAERGYCFAVLKAMPTRLVQIRMWAMPSEREPDRVLIELAELPSATRGFRAPA